MRQDITISDGTIVHTLDAFPFDSSPNLVTTEQGYRRGDRAVDAWTMQRTFAQFFSDGVFGTPADAFQIAKAASGLAVTIQPGMAVIQGAMGGIKETDGALTVTLDTAAAAGNVCYGIMLRYDNNSDVRSLGIRAVKGVAGSNPQPPAPDTSSAGVKELRLGYVTVPNGATDLSNATVTNEKGLDVCPYSAPFEEIDMSEVTADARASANEALTELLAYFESNREAIDAALSGEEATHLQQQITALQEQLADFDIDLAAEVDNATVEYTGTENPVDPKKLRVKDGGISTTKVADGAITSDKVDSSVVKFTDGASASDAASSRTAATPKCVDNKIADMVYGSYDYNVKLNTRQLNIGSVNNIPFSGSDFTANGFTLTSDGAVTDRPIVVLTVFSVAGSGSFGAEVDVKINGSVVETLHFDSYTTSATYVVFVSLDAGDKLSFRAGGQYMQSFIMQGV